MDISDTIDINLYPLLKPESQKFQYILKDSQTKFQKDGSVLLHGFLSKNAINESIAEIMSLKGDEWMTDNSHTVFLDQGDSQIPSNHPR